MEFDWRWLGITPNQEPSTLLFQTSKTAMLWTLIIAHSPVGMCIIWPNFASQSLHMNVSNISVHWRFLLVRISVYFVSVCVIADYPRNPWIVATTGQVSSMLLPFVFGESWVCLLKDVIWKTNISVTEIWTMLLFSFGITWLGTFGLANVILFQNCLIFRVH
jgi:hypothetical protein